jgi:hypothetical protein
MRKRDKYQKIQFYGQIITASIGGGVLGMLGGDLPAVFLGLCLGAVVGAMIAIHDENM